MYLYTYIHMYIYTITYVHGGMTNLFCTQIYYSFTLKLLLLLLHIYEKKRKQIKENL